MGSIDQMRSGLDAVNTMRLTLSAAVSRRDVAGPNLLGDWSVKR